MPDGVAKPCCVFTPTTEWSNKFNVLNFKNLSDYFLEKEINDLEDTLADDIFPPECSACSELESTKESANVSWRNQQNAGLMSNDFMLELRFSNLCNYRCYTCGPNASSRIEDDFIKLKIIDSRVKPSWDKSSEVVADILSKATHVNFLGGEPLYNKTALSMIPTLGNKKQISITTNGSKFVPEFKQMENLLLSFSIDALEKKNEYIRNGSDWDTVIQNLQQSLNSENIETHVVTTLSLYNVFSMFDTFQYFLSLPLHHYHLNAVRYPDFLTIASIHPDLVIEVLHEVDKCKELSLNPVMKQTLDYIEQTVGKEYSEAKWNMFLTRAAELDTFRNANILEHYPKYQKFFKNL